VTEREREKKGAEGERERNSFCLDIDIWGILLQLRKRLHAMAGWKCSSL
jgi:hypothetical protein